MRRADRLFAIIQALRGDRLRTAEWLGERLEVSQRTIYRDIADLQANGAPIDGERGVGYLLRDDYFMPALALNALEMEALRWGVGLTVAHADEALADAARGVLAKLNLGLGPTPLFSAGGLTQTDRVILQRAREAIAGSFRLEISYRDLVGANSLRVVRPLSLQHWGALWTLTSWCQSRDSFRVFRADRIEHCTTLGRFVSESRQRIEHYLKSCKEGGQE